MRVKSTYAQGHTRARQEDVLAESDTRQLAPSLRLLRGDGSDRHTRTWEFAALAAEQVGAAYCTHGRTRGRVMGKKS